LYRLPWLRRKLGPAHPPELHGPYYQWTAKENGKTVTRRLNATEAELYQEWIDNDRQLRRILQQMGQVAAKTAELKLKQAAKPEVQGLNAS
jgi:hypothetical protein